MDSNFQTVSWAQGSNIYEVNERQYNVDGTFSAFAKHLPRLKEMGIDILWLMPITPISIKNRLGTLGSYYACSSYVKINPEYGTIDDFKNLVNEAHAFGFKIIIDWVANHTGWDHEWTKEHADFYQKDADGNFIEKNGWKDVIDLDYTNKNMRAAMIDAMKFWISECDIDGFRCDMAHLIPLDFWHDARTQCDTLKPLFWLAECEVPQYHKVFDVTYAWEWMHVSEKFVKQQASLQQLNDVLVKYSQYPKGSQKLFFTSNHDENSWNGTEYEKYGDAAKAFAVFTCTWRGMPLIYSGQELPNYKRLKFFDKDLIEWNDKEPALQNFYQTLLSARKNNKAFHQGAEIFVLPTKYYDQVLAFLLVNENDKALVIINFTDWQDLQFSVSHEQLSGKYKNIFSENEYMLESLTPVTLQAFEFTVYVSF
jgi:glycosidase